MQKWRIQVVFFLFALSAGLIAWRLYDLQIKRGDSFKALAIGQQNSFQETAGERGDIFLLENSLPLTTNERKNILYIFPKKINASKEQEALEILSEALPDEKNNLLDILNGEKVYKKEISQKQKEFINKNANALTGISTSEIPSRFYLQNVFASHILGFTNQEIEGQYGIEGYYDEILSGSNGLEKKEKSSFEFLPVFFEEKLPQAAEKGSSLYLTLDSKIQSFSEKLLQEAKTRWDIDSGQIIVQEPQTGKILAMAIFPSFSPNEYSKEQDMAIFMNPCLQKLFEPGSILKPATMAGAIEENLIEPETTYTDKGFLDLGGQTIYNFNKKIWGEQTMTDVLEESINTGAVFTQQKLGSKKFLEYFKNFGFFELTGIDLQGEIYSQNELLKRAYSRDLASASFGQSIELTPMQITRFFSSVANNGKMMKPYLVEKIVNPDGKEINIKPEFQRRVISEKTALKLLAMLVSVVEQGSAQNAQIKNYYIAGKTGTAQVVKKSGGYHENQTIQSFIGIFPALNPQFTILIKLDNPKNAGTAGYCAAPLFKELAEYIISLRQIPPDHQ